MITKGDEHEKKNNDDRKIHICENEKKAFLYNIQKEKEKMSYRSLQNIISET